MKMQKSVILNNEVMMPSIGYGVFRMTNPEECENSVVQAIKAGYRLIDTAAAYENETAVGNAIRRVTAEKIVLREELFVTTKLWITDTSYEKAKDGFRHSLDRLGLDYVDLYLIHQPYHDYYGAWRALEELYEKGIIKSIGVDNFTQDRMADFLFFNRIKPAVNMVECNVFYQRENERKYLKDQNIVMQARSPLAAGRKDLFSNKILCAIAQKHHKTVAQIILRWLLQRGIVPVVKSANPVRMKENLNIFDFELSFDEMKQIASMDTGKTSFSERNTARSVIEFLEKSKQYQV